MTTLEALKVLKDGNMVKLYMGGGVSVVFKYSKNKIFESMDGDTAVWHKVSEKSFLEYYDDETEFTNI